MDTVAHYLGYHARSKVPRTYLNDLTILFLSLLVKGSYWTMRVYVICNAEPISLSDKIRILHDRSIFLTISTLILKPYGNVTRCEIDIAVL